MEIFKIQLPLVSTSSVPWALIYNEERTITLEVHPSQVEQLFKEGEHKIYVRGEVVVDHLEVWGRAIEQEW